MTCKTNPTSPDFWPFEMTRDNCGADSRVMALAWRLWIGSPPDQRTTSTLASYLARNGGVVLDPRAKWPFHRLSDAMVQRARKAGVVHSVKRRWHLTGSEGAE
jgi:hypothetical protein